MPVHEEIEITAREAKPGDVIVLFKDGDLKSGMKVYAKAGATTKVECRTKNVAITSPHGVVEFRLDAPITVLRSVPTEAEKAERDRELLEYQLDEYVTQMTRLAEADPYEFMLKKMEAYRCNVAQGLSWHAQEIAGVHYRKDVAVGFMRMVELEGATAAVVALKESLTKDIVSYARHPGGSTSASSNLVDQARGTALAEMLDDWKLTYLLAAIEKGAL